MKIARIAPEFTGYHKQVQQKEKAEQEHSEHRHHPDQRQKQDDETIDVSDESVNAAIDAFQTDAQAQSSGITADSTGEGPGLKVIFKDARGQILKQLSGEEFLKLREKVTAELRVRGKILDQKV